MSGVEVELRGHVQLIRIDRPEVLNALDAAAARAIADAVDQAEASPDVRVSVLTGGSSTFSSGGDLRAMLAGETALVGDRGLCGIARRRPSKPLVAAVEGWALGAGLELLLCCDLVIASATARLGVPEVCRGLIAAGGGALLLPRKIPLAIALEMLLVGEPISADRAASVGLVNEVVPTGTALERAIELAQKIALNGPLAVQATKAIAWQSADWSDAQMWERQAEIAGPVLGSDDAEEGKLAFAERRDPVWQGR